jgi:hypothetical protein
MSQRRTEAEAPFIFGVSGHRDLVRADLPELRSQLERVFGRFRAAYPTASFEILSPLADGADRVAAEVALACGIDLSVPMPMGQSEYERDFTTPESLTDFRRLLSAARSQFDVGDSPSTEASLSDAKLRAQKYAAVGDFIAQKSHVLILLWDGRENQKLGGTSWVKKRREHWVKLGEQKGTTPEPFGYVSTIQIVTPRQSSNAAVRPRIEIVGTLPVPDEG